jgi:hypothetical protein
MNPAINKAIASLRMASIRVVCTSISAISTELSRAVKISSVRPQLPLDYMAGKSEKAQSTRLGGHYSFLDAPVFLARAIP